MTSGKFPVPRLALAGGYTAGHVMPMLAVAESWQKRFPSPPPVFMGQSGGMEEDLLTSAGFPFLGVAGRPLFGVRGPIGRLGSYAATARGILQARRQLRREGIGLVLGFGSYVTAGIVLAGKSLGLTTAIFEANLLPGLANRRLARHVDMRFVNWPDSRRHPGWHDAVVVGQPVRRAVTRAASAQDAGGNRLLVTGGSLGSRFLNERVPPLVARLCAGAPPPQVFHQAGRGMEDEVAARYAELGIAATVVGFADLADRWGWADAAICAAGAVTLAEARVQGVPTLVVPIKAVADDHQTLNARAYSQATGHPWVGEDDWDEGREAQRLAALLAGGRTGTGANDAADAIVAAIARHLSLD